MRAVAVLLVVAFHSGIKLFPGGFIGVDVFFILSGYLITGLMLDEIGKTGTLSIRAFYARRIRRLLPAACFILIAVLVAAALWLSPMESAEVSRTARAAATYTTNFWFLKSAQDYFRADVASNPLLHMWSLAVEEQFYLVWPVLMLLAYRLRRNTRHALACIALLSILSFICCLVLTTVRPAWAFYASPARAWEFGVGGILSLLPAAMFSKHKRLTYAFGWLGLLAIVLTAVLVNKSVPFPGLIALVPALGTLAVVASGICGYGGVARLLTPAPMQLIGSLSYSWYLWHWPVLVFARAINPHLGLVPMVMLAALSLIPAALTYYLLENPIRYHPALQRNFGRTLAFGAVLTAFSLVVAQGVSAFSKSLLHRPEQHQLQQVASEKPELLQRGCFGLRKLKECSFGDLQSLTTVVLIGDSHAAQWFPAMREIAEDQKWHLVTLIKPGCPPSNLPVSLAGGGSRDDCAAWRVAAMRRISQIRPAAVLVTSYQDYENRLTWRAARNPQRALEMADRNLYDALSKATPAVLVLRDSPKPLTDIPRCLSRRVRKTGRIAPVDCSALRTNAVSPTVVRAERLAAQQVAAVHIIDLTDDFCGPTFCESMRNGIIVYRDDSHITGKFAATLAPALSRQLVHFVNTSASQSANDVDQQRIAVR